LSHDEVQQIAAAKLKLENPVALNLILTILEKNGLWKNPIGISTIEKQRFFDSKYSMIQSFPFARLKTSFWEQCQYNFAEKQGYYAHPRNHFGKSFSPFDSLPITERMKIKVLQTK
jgi:hypothetical protein